MNALDLLGDPVRRRIVEQLAAGDRRASELSRGVESEFGISQPAVAKHLRLLREAGLVAVRRDGAAAIYRLDPGVIDEVEALAHRYRRLWNQRLDALETEIARGKRARASTPASDQPSPTEGERS